MVRLCQQTKYANTKKDDCWKGISDEAKEFVQALLERNPSLRPSASAALGEKWLQPYEKKTLIPQTSLRGLKKIDVNKPLKIYLILSFTW